MTLAEFLAPLQTNNVTLVLKDKTSGNEIVNMKAGGYTHLDDTLEASEVQSWQLSIPQTSITVTINTATPEVTNEEE